MSSITAPARADSVLNVRFGPLVPVFLATALYLPTLFFIPHTAYVAVIPLLFLARPRLRFEPIDALLLVFILLGYLNIFSALDNFDLRAHASSLALLLMFAAVLVGRNLGAAEARWLVWLTVLEALSVYVEFAIGRPFLFAAQAFADGQAEAFKDTSLLYRKRAFGLSSNSSVIAQKVLMAFLLLFVYGKHIRGRWLAAAVLFGALVLTFNRTAILALAFFLGLFYLRLWWRKRDAMSMVAWTALLTLLVGTVGFVLWDEIMFQFARGNELTTRTALSKRDLLWMETFSFIRENPVWGNHSMTFRFPFGEILSHPHNSYLQMIATHGVLAALLFGYVFLSLRLRNLVFVLPVLLFSLTQYGIFWNFSYLDVIFFHLLFVPAFPYTWPILGREPASTD